MHLKNLGKNMTNLQKNKLLLTIVFLFSLSGCVSARYHAGKEKPLGTDIEVSPDRVIVECEFITDYDGDYSDPYGFLIHVLDLQNTVLTLSSGTVLEKEYCFEILKISEKIIKNAQLVTLRGRGDAHSPIEMDYTFKHIFKNHGTYFGNGRNLNFLAIWNDKGQCYDAFHRGDEECQK